MKSFKLQKKEENKKETDSQTKTTKDEERQSEIEKEEKMRAEAREKAEKELKAEKKKKESKQATFGCLALVVIIILISIISSIGDSGKEKKNLTPEEKREQTIEEEFSAWDGSHRELTRVIKESMNNPDSYEHVKTRYIDNSDHLIVFTTFRGENAFGGTVKNTVKARVSLDGENIEILDQY